METERSHSTERILNLTLEIMYLLTGENYIAFKLSDGLVTSSLMKNQISVIESSSHSLKKDNKKIQGFLKEMIELLAEEIPIKWQDGTMYFSIKDWDSLEGNKDLYKDVIDENRPSLKSPEGSSNRNPPERCPRPLYSQDFTQEYQEIPHEDQDENHIPSVTETREEAKDLYVRADDPCKGGDILPEISSDPGDMGSEDELNVMIKEEDSAPEISTGGQYIRNNTEDRPIIYSDCEIKDEGIMISSTKQNPFIPNLHPIPYSADLSPGAFTHGGWLSDYIHPIAHREDHGNPKSIPCPECGKCFSEKSKLVTHRRSHSGEKPFSCKECGKSFKQSAHLVSHHRTHTRVHPYSCSECGKCFSQKSNLIRHEKVHTGEKSFSCSQCGKRFSEKSNLIRHEKIHTGEKPFSCSECGKSFSLRANLIAHVRTHTGEKPFACFACGKCFSRKSVLDIHKRVHTGEKPYSCADCGKCFSKRFLLARHARLHTGEKSFSQPLMDSFPKEPTSSFTRGLSEVINRFCYQAVDSYHINSHVSLPAGDKRFLSQDVAGK